LGAYRQTHSFAATGCPGSGMTRDQFWQPDRQTRSAIRRGDKINREYFKRKSIEYQRALIERLESIDKDWCAQ